MRREYVSLGAARQVRVMPSESWGSSRRGNFSRHLVAFEMRLSRYKSNKMISQVKMIRTQFFEKERKVKNVLKYQ